jgi:hypothetical protein
MIASGSRDALVKIWDPKSERDVATIHAHKVKATSERPASGREREREGRGHNTRAQGEGNERATSEREGESGRGTWPQYTRTR